LGRYRIFPTRRDSVAPECQGTTRRDKLDAAYGSRRRSGPLRACAAGATD